MTPYPGMAGPQPAGSQKYTLPTVALVLSIVGLCFCPVSLLGAVLGLVALLKIGKEPALSGKGLAIAAMIVPVATVPILGIQAAIAIPNFIRYQARAKQAECQVNLKALWTAQQRYRVEHDRWARTPEELEARLESARLYSYFIGDDELSPALARGADRDAYREALRSLGVARDSGDEVTIACVGNIDQDATLDVWVVSSRDGADATGASVTAGTPRHVVDDVTE